jgi:hypothetical protein
MGSPPTAAAMVPTPSAPPAKFSFRAFARRRKPAAGSSIALRGAQSREVVRTDAKQETLGGIFARSINPGLGAAVAGAMDGSPVSKAIEEATDGWFNLSDLALVAGSVARGADLDGKVPLIGPYFKRGNTHFISGTIAAKFYNAGRKGSAHLFRDKTKQAEAKPAKKSEELVPGEATVS